MRWDLFLFGAGAVLTALGVKYADQPWLWDGTIYLGIAIMVGSLLDVLKRKLSPDKQKMSPLIGMVVFGVAFVGCAGWYFWLASRREQASHDPASNVRTDPSVFIDCQTGFLPKVMPASGRIYMLQLQPLPQASGGGGLGQQFGDPGSEIGWPKSEGGMPVQAYRCDVTNYGNGPIFNVEIAVRLTFLEVIHDSPNSMRSGAVTLTRDWSIPISKIDAGANNPFSFYIANFQPLWAMVQLPDTATFQAPGESAPRVVRLMRPQAYPMNFTPFIPGKPPTNPPAEFPQAQAPPK